MSRETKQTESSLTISQNRLQISRSSVQSTLVTSFFYFLFLGGLDFGALGGGFFAFPVSFCGKFFVKGEYVVHDRYLDSKGFTTMKRKGTMELFRYIISLSNAMQ